MPKGHYDRSTSAWTPPEPKQYPPALVAKVRTLYGAGMTMRETAEEVGVSVRVLQRLMPRHGISRRPAAPRDQRGKNNGNWKEGDAKYAALHKRVRVERGDPGSCSVCGALRTWIDWANLTGKYDDIHDYAAMCRPCHRAYDAGRRS